MITDIDLEKMTFAEMRDMVDAAVQAASHGDVVMFHWLEARAHPCMGHQTEGERRLEQLIKQKRAGVPGMFYGSVRHV